MSLRLVIFDCDGVLVDSEPVSRQVIAAEAGRLGWPLSPDEARAFTGLRWGDLRPVFEARTGRVLPADWALSMQDRLIARMDDILPVAHAADVLQATSALGLPYRVASNSSHEEMAVKFARTGLTDLVAGRLHSARDVGVGKPAPDVFLAAAASGGVAPDSCLVVEDSPPGIEAARAAGMACIAYAPEGGRPDGVLAAIRSLAELPAIFAARMRSAPAAGRAA